MEKFWKDCIYCYFKLGSGLQLSKNKALPVSRFKERGTDLDVQMLENFSTENSEEKEGKDLFGQPSWFKKCGG